MLKWLALLGRELLVTGYNLIFQRLWQTPKAGSKWRDPRKVDVTKLEICSKKTGVENHEKKSIQ